MEIADLKRLLIQRISAISDPGLLQEAKRLLTKEGRGGDVPLAEDDVFPYFGLEDRNYTAEEVRAIMAKMVHALQADAGSADLLLDADEWEELASEHKGYLKGEAKVYTWEQVRELIRVDRRQ